MLNTVNLLLWINISVIALIISIKLTIKSKFIQFNIIKLLKSLNKQNNTKGITNFQALMISLGGKIGVGSISGIAIAIYYGGPGTILWLLLISVILSILTYYEVYLGNIYKEYDTNNIYKGGPSYYIKKGLKNRKLSIIYTLLIVICYNGCFISIQSNTIMKMTSSLFGINTILIGIIICITTLLIIYKGIKEIAAISNYLVPTMIIIYIILANFVFINNIDKLPHIFSLIYKDAFNTKSLISSFIPMIIMSIQRTIFATESGLGTTSIVSSTTASNSKTQAQIQVLGVYITTFVICLSTAIIILTTNYYSLNFNNINGIELVIYAFNYHFGKLGKIILYIIVLLFCFSTIITGYYNGESSIKSLKIKKIYFLKMFTIIVLFLGVLIKPKILWNITDLLIGILLIINTYSIYKLKDKVKE